MVPVAVIDSDISPLITVAVSKVTLCLAVEPPNSWMLMTATDKAATAIRIIFLVFIY